MPEYRMRVLSSPEDSHDAWPPRSNRRRASGETGTYLCGMCGIILARNAPAPQIALCFNCGACNTGVDAFEVDARPAPETSEPWAGTAPYSSVK